MFTKSYIDALSRKRERKTRRASWPPKQIGSIAIASAIRAISPSRFGSALQSFPFVRSNASFLRLRSGIIEKSALKSACLARPYWIELNVCKVFDHSFSPTQVGEHALPGTKKTLTKTLLGTGVDNASFAASNEPLTHWHRSVGIQTRTI